jgi:hypothetical protein
MAVGKAVAPDICAASAACRSALEAVVAQFNEVIDGIPTATVRRRLKDANIDLEGLRPSPVSELPTAITVIECKNTE